MTAVVEARQGDFWILDQDSRLDCSEVPSRKEFRLSCSARHRPSGIGGLLIALLLTVSGCGLLVPAASGGSTRATQNVGHLSIAPLTLRFGEVEIGRRSTLPVVITNTGLVNVTIFRATVSGSGFSLKGSSLPTTLSEHHAISFSVSFAPKTTGSVTGNVSLTSNAANSPFVGSLSGAGVEQHLVILSWNASPSHGVIGYNVYRGTTSGGPYTRLNSFPTAANRYTDATAQAGRTYFYVTTAVNSRGLESAYSNQVKAIVPPP